MGKLHVIGGHQTPAEVNLFCGRNVVVQTLATGNTCCPLSRSELGSSSRRSGAVSAGNSSNRLCAHSGSPARVGISVGGHARRDAAAEANGADTEEADVDATLDLTVEALSGAVVAGMADIKVDDVVAVTAGCG